MKVFFKKLCFVMKINCFECKIKCNFKKTPAPLWQIVSGKEDRKKKKLSWQICLPSRARQSIPQGWHTGRPWAWKAQSCQSWWCQSLDLPKTHGTRYLPHTYSCLRKALDRLHQPLLLQWIENRLLHKFMYKKLICIVLFYTAVGVSIYNFC